VSARIRLLSKIAAVCTLLGAAPSRAEVAPLTDLESVYSVHWAGVAVGDAMVSLKADGSTGCYRYTTTTHPVSFIKALYGEPTQASRFCVKDGRVRSQHFESVLASDRKQSYALTFDYQRHIVIDENGKTREIPDEAVDSFSLQQAVRLWVEVHANDANPPVAEFTMVDQKNLTHYQFRLAGHEMVKTPAGSFDALKMERIDNPDKAGRFWLAAERGYMPVKIETRNGKKPTVQLLLKQ